MKVKYDFPSGKLQFDFGEAYNIESIRRYAVNYHPATLSKYFVKAIRSKGRNVFTYDFDGFFEDVDIPFLRQYKKYLSSCYDDNIRPVSGITQSPECLDAIYQSVHRQFIVDDHEFKLLQGKMGRGDGRGNQYPLMVFSGVADMHGFTHADILEEAQMDSPSSSDHLHKLLDEFQSQIEEGTTKPNRLYHKTRLVLNDLRMRYERYVDLGDINY